MAKYTCVWLHHPIKLWLGKGKLVLSTCQIWPDFESLKYNNILSVISIVSAMSSNSYAYIHEKFNKNRYWIAHTEQEIGAIIWTSVFYVDKTCFPRPGHNYYQAHCCWLPIQVSQDGLMLILICLFLGYDLSIQLVLKSLSSEYDGELEDHFIMYWFNWANWLTPSIAAFCVNKLLLTSAWHKA